MSKFAILALVIVLLVPQVSTGQQNVGNRAQQIFRVGQDLGNRADVFSKVGDSITAVPQFLWQIGVGGLHLHDYADLQPVVEFYLQTPARDHNSFANTSLAAQPGWSSFELLNPDLAPGDLCEPGESPLVCEYRVVKPAVALIMIGTNDVMRGVDLGSYRQNLNVIVQTSIDMGVIPVLSTIPDNLSNPDFEGRVHEFNSVIISVARNYGIPLWNYWAALQNIPNRGLSGDGVHPSVDPSGEAAILSPEAVNGYGYTQRNLTALQVLNAIWQAVLR